jgi:hypothetical protein
MLANSIEFKVMDELIDKDPEFLVVHGVVMTICRGITSSVIFDPLDVSWGEMMVRDCSPVFNGTIKLLWSELVVMIGVNIVENLV